MARQPRSSQSLKSIVGMASIGLGLVILFVTLDGPAGEMSHLLGIAARATLELLPSFVPAAWQALQVLAFGHHWFSAVPVQMLLSFGPPLMVVAGTI